MILGKIERIQTLIFNKNNPGTFLWKILFLWRNLPRIIIKPLIFSYWKIFKRRNVQFYGEFGYELIAVIPYAYWLFKRNKLIFTRGVKDTKCLYYFSKNHSELDKKRLCLNVKSFPIGHIHKKKINKKMWEPPPYKKIYKNNRFVWDNPICVIGNKYTVEWSGPPVNYISLEILKELFKILQKKYQIIYNRPTSIDIAEDQQRDHNFQDFAILKEQFPYVITMQNLNKNNKDLSYNQIQMMIYANCNRFISVQGGNCVFTSYFGGKNIILAMRGAELKYNSYNWYHKLSGSKIFHVDNSNDLIEIVKREFL